MDGLDRIGWIVSTGFSGSYRLDRIGNGIGFARKNWLLCAGWFDNGWMGNMDRMGRWWDGGGIEVPTLAGAGMGAPPLALERERHHWLLRGSGRWEVVADTNCVGASRARSICVREAI